MDDNKAWNLDVWCARTIGDIRSFGIHWIKMSAADPANYPKDLLPGEWDERFDNYRSNPERKAETSGWFMFDNHTFKKVDLVPGWKTLVANLFQQDPWGAFFVRDHRDEQLYSLQVGGEVDFADIDRKLTGFEESAGMDTYGKRTTP